MIEKLVNFIPVVAGYYDRADMLNTTEPDETGHRHAVSEIMYVVDGSCTVRVGRRKYFLTRRQYIWINAGVGHQLLLQDGEMCSMMNIEYFFRLEPIGGMSMGKLAAAYPPLAEWINAQEPCKVLADEDDAVFSLMKQAVALADSEHVRAEGLCSMLTGILTLLMARAVKSGATPRGTGAAGVARAIERMRESLDEPFTSSKLARELGLNPTYFARVFRANCGVSPARYFLNLRIRRAQELLAGSNKSILQISSETGFSWQQHFSQVFRRETGMSPSAYREKYRVMGNAGAARGEAVDARGAV